MYYPKVLERVDSPEQIFHRSFLLGAPDVTLLQIDVAYTHVPMGGVFYLLT